MKRSGILQAIVATLILGAAQAWAQTAEPQDEASRAQALSSAREQKSAELTKPEPSLVERALYWYDTGGARLRWRAVHFSGGTFPNGAGIAYGIGITEKAMGASTVEAHQPNRIDGDVFVARTFRGYQRVSARLDMLNVTGRSVDAVVRWSDYRHPQEDFYGLGAGSDRARRTNYRVHGTEYGAGLSWRVTPRFTIGGDLAHLTTVIGTGTDRRYTTTQAVFADLDAPGLADVPPFVRGDLSVAYDWRDSHTHPRRGGRYKTTVSQYAGINDAGFDFRRIDVSAQQIVPLPNRYRRLELRAAAAFTDASAGSRVPFFYQPALGGTQTLRGFSEYRYRDRNAVWASAEYQWEAWWALDAAFFIDAGQVAATRDQLTLRNFEVTYGVGLRLHGNDRFIARLDLARSREGFRPILGFNYGF